MKIEVLRNAVEALAGFWSQAGPNRQFEHYYAELLAHDGAVAPSADEALHDYEVMLHSQLAA